MMLQSTHFEWLLNEYHMSRNSKDVYTEMLLSIDGSI